ncbi:hypothetical protein FCV25MIE_17198, partial [Fagus crenata]
WLEWDNRGIFGSTEYVEYGDSGVVAAVQGRSIGKDTSNQLGRIPEQHFVKGCQD